MTDAAGEGPKTLREGDLATERVRGFPWGSLEHWTNREVASLRAAHRALSTTALRTRLEVELSNVLGAPVTIRAGRPRPLAYFSSERVGFALSIRAADHLKGLFVESAFADRLLRAAYQRPERTMPLAPLDRDAPKVASALLAIAGALARRSGVPEAAPQRAVTTLAALNLESWILHAFGENAFGVTSAEAKGTVVVPAVVDAGEESFAAALFLPANALFDKHGDHPTAFELGALGGLRLRLSVIRELIAVSDEELSALRVGDVLLLDSSARAPTGDTDAPLAVTLGAIGGERRVSADLVADGKIVLRFSRPIMADPDLSRTLEEAPVVVRVEVGSIELPALEWADLADGDVVKLEQSVGAAVVLRVGSALVAEGELVDVEGTLGVRILRRL